MPEIRYAVQWPTEHGLFRAFEPTAAEVAATAPELAAYYNDAHNRAMMAHAAEMSAAEVGEHFANLRDHGGRGFLLELDGALMGDADFRHMTASAAEFAIMIGARRVQGKGLGTRFALLLHALAYGGLSLERVFVTIIPANQASQRLFQKLGYESDNSPAARAYIDDEDDVTLSMERAKFEREHAAAVKEICWSARLGV